MRHVLAAALLLVGTPAGATTITLDFEEEVLGYRSDPFVSAEWDGATLDAAPLPLTVIDLNGSRVLFVGEQGGSLRITLAVPVLAISLDFGGDQAGEDWDVGPARLVGYFGGVEVASAQVEANRNYLIDQTIAIAGGPFDTVRFFFSQLGPDQPASPIVDNIVMSVPEPAALALLLLAGYLVAMREDPVEGDVGPDGR